MGILRFIATLSFSLVLPYSVGVSVPETSETHAESLIYISSSSGVLASTYKLPVAEMPPPPTISVASTSADQLFAEGSGGCFFSLRAVVEGENSRDSFAMISIDGESRMLHQGEKLTHGGSTYRVKSIKNNKIVLLAAARTVRCDLREREGQ